MVAVRVDGGCASSPINVGPHLGGMASPMIPPMEPTLPTGYYRRVRTEHRTGTLCDPCHRGSNPAPVRHRGRRRSRGQRENDPARDHRRLPAGQEAARRLPDRAGRPDRLAGRLRGRAATGQSGGPAVSGDGARTCAFSRLQHGRPPAIRQERKGQEAFWG